MGVLNFWAPRSQCVNMQGGNGEFGQLITKKNQGVLQVLYFFFSFFIVWLALSVDSIDYLL